MKALPLTENPLILRTDFSNDGIWQAICADILKPVAIFRFGANVNFLDDIEYAAIDKQQLLKLVPRNYTHSFIVLVDRTAITHPDHPLLVIDLYEGSGQEFRTIPSCVQSIENNLSIANIDFEEFAETVGEDRIFRGFPRN